MTSLSFVAVENSLPETMVDIEFPGRKIVFPIALDDRWNHEAPERYMSTTGRKAVYLPSNIDHLARRPPRRRHGGVGETYGVQLGNQSDLFYCDSR